MQDHVIARRLMRCGLLLSLPYDRFERVGPPPDARLETFWVRLLLSRDVGVEGL